MEIKFIVDNNVGKLARWLRMMGYDTLLFKKKNDSKMIRIALRENRVILTKDTQLMKRRVITSGKLKAVLITQNDPKAQLQATVGNLNLSYFFSPFSLCLECNQRLMPRDKKEVQNSVPPYVFKTQNQYMECPVCHRIYWQGTHWQAMTRELKILQKGR
ncbi:MAG: Mut7-C RNAse domain-containing protein [Dehalococcoidia bacterium]|nr:Mut7-C RNAse domain-containing protein [Dehalococcoidia bacterium]